MPLTLSGVPQSQNLTLSNVPTQGMPLSNAPMGLGSAADQQPDIVQMLGKYGLGAAPGMLGAVGPQSVGAPVPMTPPPPAPPGLNPILGDDFIPRGGPRTPTGLSGISDMLNQLSKMNMGQTPPQVVERLPAPSMASSEIMPNYDPAASYRDYSNKLGAMLKSGQLTPERANALKAPIFEATKLGNTRGGSEAMQRAIAAAEQALPAFNYNPAERYSEFGNQLASLISAGILTPQQANAFKAPVFEATRLGNSVEGQRTMNGAIQTARIGLPSGALEYLAANTPKIPY